MLQDGEGFKYADGLDYADIYLEWREGNFQLDLGFAWLWYQITPILGSKMVTSNQVYTGRMFVKG